MSSRTQTTEVLLRWKHVRKAVGRALYSLLLNSLLPERPKYSDTSQTTDTDQNFTLLYEKNIDLVDLLTN